MFVAFASFNANLMMATHVHVFLLPLGRFLLRTSMFNSRGMEKPLSRADPRYVLFVVAQTLHGSFMEPVLVARYGGRGCVHDKVE